MQNQLTIFILTLLKSAPHPPLPFYHEHHLRRHYLTTKSNNEAAGWLQNVQWITGKMMHKWFPANTRTLSLMKRALYVLHVSVSPWCTYVQYVDGFYSNRISYSCDNCLHSEQQSPTSKAETQQVGGEHTAQTHTPSLRTASTPQLENGQTAQEKQRG